MPPESAGEARVIGLGGALRTFGDELNDEFAAEIARAVERRPPEKRARDEHGRYPPVAFLAISGGGSDGAYGAGLLGGWSARGDRPAFDLVTGISTGALIAPFAFLGSDYDGRLRHLYTTIRTQDALCQRNIVEGILGDAIADSAPLRRMIRRHIGQEMMDGVAAAYGEGRLLLVGTTDLDAQRAVIWNMGVIASSGQPGALDLFQSVLLASASIPGAFPPVMIDVDVGGRRHQEMHVDGGTTTQVFVYPPSTQLEDDRERDLYVIRNGRLQPQWAQVERSTLRIGARSVDSLIATQGIGDLYRIFLTAERDRIAFHLASIPPSFAQRPTETFDPPYMSALYDVGYARGYDGSAWSPYPPGYAPPDPDPPALTPPPAR